MKGGKVDGRIIVALIVLGIIGAMWNEYLRFTTPPPKPVVDEAPKVKEPDPMEAKLDKLVGLIDKVDKLQSDIQVVRAEANKDPILFALKQLSDRQGAFETEVRNHRPPKPPEVYKLQLVGPVQVVGTLKLEDGSKVELNGKMNIMTPEGERVRVLHKSYDPRIHKRPPG